MGTTEEWLNKESKLIDVDFAEIIVRGKIEKPYYEIMYHEIGDKENNYYFSFGSYFLDYVFDWKEKYFNIITKDNA